MQPRAPRRNSGAVLVLIALAMAACSTGAPATATADPAAIAPAVTDPAVTAPDVTAPSVAAPDPFADLPYRMGLPADWAVLGTPAYDGAIDAAPDVAAWLKGLDLEGQYAFRAYEPLPGATGLRVAINPLQTWNPSPLQEEGAVAALLGVTGKVSSDVLATGADWKASGYRWDETMDWGDGSPSARTCVGYFVMVDNPVNMVFCYPAATDRAADVDALVSTFVVLGNPVFSLPPGETPTPSPTPYDKYASQEPLPTFHADPAMEALLPDTLDGRPVTKESRTGVEAGKTETDPMLKAFGKQPADYADSTGTLMPTGDQPGGSVGVFRLRGVPGDQLLAFWLAQMPEAKVSKVTLGGHEVTYVEYGAWPTWMYATGDLVYAVGLAGEETAAAFFAALP
jgi:hypothetical protein